MKAMTDVLGRSFKGTSNTYLAYEHDLEAIGTNAHELPMALAAMAHDDEELKSAQYRLLELWQQTYQRELLIMLPDTFGTTQFLKNAPDWAASWTGQRADSKDPFVAGDEYIAWLEEHGQDARQKLFIASDALDVDKILGLHAYFAGKIRKGVSLTNFRNCAGLIGGRILVSIQPSLPQLRSKSMVARSCESPSSIETENLTPLGKVKMAVSFSPMVIFSDIGSKCASMRCLCSSETDIAAST